MKLYFMLGTPFRAEDIRGIAELSNKIAALYYEVVPKENGPVQIVSSTSSLSRSRSLPFQWAPMCTKEQFWIRQR